MFDFLTLKTEIQPKQPTLDIEITKNRQAGKETAIEVLGKRDILIIYILFYNNILFFYHILLFTY